MKTDDMLRKEIHTALERRLAGVTEQPGSQEKILRLIRGEEKIMKKKLSTGLILVIALLLATMAMAFAVGGFGLLDFKKDQANNKTFIEHIIPVGQNYENAFLTLTVNEAVFNGTTLSFTMDITVKDKSVPVYLLPVLTADVGEETLTTTFENCTGGFNGQYGFWLPEMDPRMPGGTLFGAEALLTDASGAPYVVTNDNVCWHLSFYILRPNWPVSYAAIALPAADSDSMWSEEMDEAYYRQFAEAYENKRILLSDTGSLIDFVEQQLYLDGLSGNTDFFAAMKDSLTHCDAFTVVDCPVITFSTPVSTHTYTKAGQVFSFDDGWQAEVTELSVTFDRVDCTMKVTRNADDGRTARDMLLSGEAWQFAILAEDATTTPYTASCGGDPSGYYEWSVTVTLSAPAARIIIVPCRTSEEWQGEAAKDGYIPVFDTEYMVYQNQAPYTEEQKEIAFAIDIIN